MSWSAGLEGSHNGGTLFERPEPGGEPEQSGLRVSLMDSGRTQRLDLQELHAVTGEASLHAAQHEPADSMPVVRRLDRHQVDLGGIRAVVLHGRDADDVVIDGDDHARCVSAVSM